MQCSVLNEKVQGSWQMESDCASVRIVAYFSTLFNRLNVATKTHEYALQDNIDSFVDDRGSNNNKGGKSGGVEEYENIDLLEQDNADGGNAYPSTRIANLASWNYGKELVKINI